MVEMRPTERLEYLLQQKELNSAHTKIHELMNCYKKFLDKTNVEERMLIEQFLDKDRSKEFFLQVNEFGDLVSELLRLIGGQSRSYRLLIV